MIKKILSNILKFLDFFIFPFVLFVLVWLKIARKTRFKCQKCAKKLCFYLGVYPIIDHYYDPQIDPKYLFKSPREDRYLPGIVFNDKKNARISRKFKLSN